ncbi:hypothetical protein P9112_011050 [Eukaryota sp. TZLM1-RC]
MSTDIIFLDDKNEHTDHTEPLTRLFPSSAELAHALSLPTVFNLNVFLTQQGQLITRYNTDFIHHKKIGKGGFGDVFLAQSRLDNLYYAVKRISFSQSSLNFDKVLREVRILAKLSHPLIVRYFSSWIEPILDDPDPNPALTSRPSSPQSLSLSRWCLYISTELCAPYTLKQLLESPSSFSHPKSIPQLQKSLLLALNYLHSQGVVHRDIKPLNVLFQLTSSSASDEPRLLPKLADFGLAQDTLPTKTFIEVTNQDNTDGTSSVLGTPWYASPEQLEGSKSSFYSDIFSLGLVFFELEYGPFLGSQKALLFNKMRHGECVFEEDDDSEIRSIIELMTHVTPEKRSSARDLLNLEYFANISFNFDDGIKLSPPIDEANFELPAANNSNTLSELKTMTCSMISSCQDLSSNDCQSILIVYQALVYCQQLYQFSEKLASVYHFSQLFINEIENNFSDEMLNNSLSKLINNLFENDEELSKCFSTNPELADRVENFKIFVDSLDELSDSRILEILGSWANIHSKHLIKQNNRDSINFSFVTDIERLVTSYLDNDP